MTAPLSLPDYWRKLFGDANAAQVRDIFPMFGDASAHHWEDVAFDAFMRAMKMAPDSAARKALLIAYETHRDVLVTKLESTPG